MLSRIGTRESQFQIEHFERLQEVDHKVPLAPEGAGAAWQGQLGDGMEMVRDGHAFDPISPAGDQLGKLRDSALAGAVLMKAATVSEPSLIEKAWMLSESLNAPDIEKVSFLAADHEVDFEFNRIGLVIDERLQYYNRRIAELPEGRLQQHYQGLAAAMERDLQMLRDGASLSKNDKVSLHNRMAQEVRIEIKYHVDLIDLDVAWNTLELDLVESALEKLDRLSPAFTRENENLGRIFKTASLEERSGPERALHPGNVIVVSAETRFFDQEFGVNLLERTVIEQVAAKLQMDPALWTEFMNLSGWKDLGDQNLFPKLSTGDVSTAQALGIQGVPPATRYVVSKRDGHTFAHPESRPVGFVRADAQTVAQQFKQRFDDGTMTPTDDFMQSLSEYILSPTSTKLPQAKRDFIENLIKQLRE